jgi:hypothetical protein
MEGSFAKATRFILTIIEWIKFKIKIPQKTCGGPAVRHTSFGAVFLFMLSTIISSLWDFRKFV